MILEESEEYAAAEFKLKHIYPEARVIYFPIEKKYMAWCNLKPANGDYETMFDTPIEAINFAIEAGFPVLTKT